MTPPAPIIRRIRWINLPVVMLITLLQRTPVVRLLLTGGEYAITSPLGQVLRAAATVATLGAMHSRAGATEFVGPNFVAGTVGTNLQVGFAYTGTPAPATRWEFSGSLPPGLRFIPEPVGNNIPSGTPVIAGKPTAGGSFQVTLQVFDAGGFTDTPQTVDFTIAGGGGGSSGSPSITAQPSNQSAGVGGSVNLSVAASGATGFQWQRNGANVAGGTGTTLAISNLQPASTGLYAAVASGGSGSSTSSPAIVGLTSAEKLVGPGTEFPNITASNGNIYDQILLEGAAATVKPDTGQILRISFIDLNDDIVQIEMSGSGALSLVLAGVSGPAAPVNYSQSVTYMKGHVGIVVTGARVDTNLSVFSVGRANAANQALFKDVAYDGFADIAFIAITSSDGQFGGLRAANTHMFASEGFTGLFAPNVQFTGPVFVGNVTTTASSTATPLFIIGSGGDVRVTGGDLFQGNSRPVQVKGITQLKFTAGSTSHGTVFAAQQNKGVLQQDGTDVTSQIVVFSP